MARRVGMLALAMLLTYSGFRINQGSLTLGVLVAFLQYGMRFFRPIQDLSEKYNLLQSAMAAAERIFGLLDTPVEVAAPAQPKPVPDHGAAIEFDHVWFAYKGEDWVLRDVSFRIEPGETVAVVGHTGAGKTTIISLLLRFYDIQRGSIRIGGTDVREFDPAELRRRFGVVLQDPHLFTGTIEGNIRLGTDGITDEDMRSAAEQVNLLDFIRSLPDGFAQPVRERRDQRAYAGDGRREHAEHEPDRRRAEAALVAEHRHDERVRIPARGQQPVDREQPAQSGRVQQLP